MISKLSKAQIKTLILLLVFVFGVSLAYSLYFKITPAVDARAYDTIALNILQDYGYREAVDTPLENDNAIVRVGPGYEFFLALVYYLFGHSYKIVWILQAAILTASAGLVFLISREVFKENWTFTIGLISLALIGFSPDLITIQGMLMTETLGIFFLVASVFLLFKYIGEERLSYLFFFSIVFGLGILVRTPIAFLALPIVFYFLKNKLWRHVLILGVLLVIIFLPWTVRNWKIYHSFIPTNAASGFNLLAGNHPGANGEQEPYPPLDTYVRDFGHIGANNKATKEAVNFISTHPLEFIKITILRTSIYFSFARPTGFWFHLHGTSKKLTLISSSIYALILFSLGLLGIWQIKLLNLEEKRKAKILLAMLVMMPLAIVGVIVETRYRFLVYPFFAVFAGFGFSEFVRRKIQLKSALIILGLFFLNSGFDVLRNFGRIIERIHGL